MGAHPKTYTKDDWKKVVRKYSTPDNAKSWWQVINTLVPLFFLWWLAYKSLEVSYWLTLAISVINVPFFVRTFIIFHDCGHGSFFKSRKLRTFMGYITGIITLTPYHQWTKDHARHHQTSGNLDKRGGGDVWTITVSEYQDMTFWQKLSYRLYRNPFVTFIVGPFWLFQLRFRFFEKTDGPKEKESVIITNIALAVIIGTLCYFIGWKNFLLVHVPVQLMSQVFGVYLFYVQHQYEESYWRRQEDWDYFDASMQGSSYFKLPKLLQWGSGNIGLHHLHHLSHLIPNYNLEKCMNENPMFQNPKVITLASSIPTIFLKFYDEEAKEMITYNQYLQRYCNRSPNFALRLIYAMS